MNDKNIYEVWGLDTFSNEVYFCGSFDNREDAEALMEQKGQSGEDRYQILEKTPETVNNRPRCRFRVPLIGWVTDED